MRRPPRRPLPLVGLVGLVGLLVACAPSEPTAAIRSTAAAPPKKAPEPEVTPSPPTPPTPTAPPTPKPPLAAGPAYLMISEGPIVRVDASGFTTLPSPENFLYPVEPVRGVGPHLHSLGRAIYAIEGDRLRELVRLTDHSSCIHVLVVGLSDLRFVCSEGVRAWDGAAWTSTRGPESDDPDRGHLLPAGVALDRAGALWVATKGALYRQDVAGWTRIAQVDPSDGFVDLAAAPDDGVYVLGGGGLFAASTAAPELRPVDVSLPPLTSPSDLAVSPRGDLAIVGRSLADVMKEEALGPAGSLAGYDASDTHLDWFALIRDADGKIARYTLADAIQVGLPSAFGIDGRGRVWWGASHGVAILAVDAAPVLWWRGAYPGDQSIRSDFDRFNGRGGVSSVLVVDGGPDLPATPTATPTRARGRLKDGRKPLAGVEIEACTAPRHHYRGSPCAHDRGRRAATTGDDGRFEWTDVHPGEHRVYARVDGTWRDVDALLVVSSISVREVALGDVTFRP